jgi:hypothetical protein
VTHLEDDSDDGKMHHSYRCLSRPSSHEEAAVPFPIFAGNISGGHDMQTMTNDIYHRSRLIGP